MTQKKEPSEQSPVFTRARKVLPRVQQADNPWSLPLGIVGAAVIGATVFTGLSRGREENVEALVPPPPIEAPLTEVAAPPPPQPAPPPPVAVPQVIQGFDPSDARLRAPAVVYDVGSSAPQPVQVAQANTTPPAATAAAVPAAAEDGTLSADERFAARVTGGASDSAKAYRLRDVSHVVPQGTVIPAVLETALDSDLPGSVRGVVSRPVKSFDGSRILIPVGSTLIGQYKSAVAEGQSRAFVIWSRVITPVGISIDIGSPATDRLGRGGLDGEVDTHFFSRFGAAILLSVFDAGVSIAGGRNGSTTNLIIASPAQASRIAEIALQRQITIPATIRVPPGAPVQVFVARDLDFSNVVQ